MSSSSFWHWCKLCRRTQQGEGKGVWEGRKGRTKLGQEGSRDSLRWVTRGLANKGPQPPLSYGQVRPEGPSIRSLTDCFVLEALTSSSLQGEIPRETRQDPKPGVLAFAIRAAESCYPSWPQAFCLSLPNVGTTGVHHYAWKLLSSLLWCLCWKAPSRENTTRL